MSEVTSSLKGLLEESLGDRLQAIGEALGETTVDVSAADLPAVGLLLRDTESLSFEMLIDLCAVDYLDLEGHEGERFAVVYHLLSIRHNRRLSMRVWLPEDDLRLSTVTTIWSSANWFEREAFDLFGVLFEGHPDLRRLLTDYGFIGHPFRKDFPLIGNVEMRYDEEKRRVVYQPVSIEPRIGTPRVIRHDHRYLGMTDSDEVNGG